MASDDSELMKSLDIPSGWSVDGVNVGIPGYLETRFASPSGHYEVEFSPRNGYDDGNPHEDRLHFFVNVYEYRVDDNGDRIEESGRPFSRQKDSAEAAAELLQEKLNEYAQKPDA